MAAPPGLIPIVQVAYRKGMWWSLPVGLSRAIYESHERGEDYAYTWDWGEARTGSYTLDDGSETSLNNYAIDLRAMEQKNCDNGRRRSVRIVWIRPQDETPQWTGEIPQQS